jgi:hypothetical protein
MKQYDIWYAIDPTFSTDHNLNLDDLQKSHKYVQTFEADSLDDCYNKMQEDVWSPDGEGKDLIRCLGVHHISMRIGDIVIEAENKDMAWQCAGEEWTRIYRSTELSQACNEELADQKGIMPEFQPNGNRQYPVLASIYNLRHAIENTERETRV